MSCALLILRNAFPYNTKVRASNTVDLPAPLEPIISVVLLLLRFSFVSWLPVERKFFQEMVLKVITSVVGRNYNVIRGYNRIPVVMHLTGLHHYLIFYF